MRKARSGAEVKEFTVPRNTFYGFGALANVTAIPAKRAMVVSDAVMAGLGWVEKVKAILEANGTEVTVFTDVEPDPSRDTVASGAAIMRECRPEVVVGLGGGSSIDAGKAMWVFYELPEMTWEIASVPFSLPPLRSKATIRRGALDEWHGNRGGDRRRHHQHARRSSRQEIHRLLRIDARRRYRRSGALSHHAARGHREHGHGRYLARARGLRGGRRERLLRRLGDQGAPACIRVAAVGREGWQRQDRKREDALCLGGGRPGVQQRWSWDNPFARSSAWVRVGSSARPGQRCDHAVRR